MKTKSVFALLLLLILNLVSCRTVAIPRGGHAQQQEVINQYRSARPIQGPDYIEPNYSGSGYRHGYNDQYRGPNGAGQVIYHGSQADHVYGSGIQTYAKKTWPRGGYDPNYNYGQ